MLFMSKLTEHYRQLLGLDASWEVPDVSLSLEEKRVEITLVHRGGPVTCPDCGAECAIADHAPERAWMLKRPLDNILTYFRHGLTNAMSEGFNSRIQSIKSQTRGFRAFENYRTRILVYCGKLDLLPPGISH